MIVLKFGLNSNTLELHVHFLAISYFMSDWYTNDFYLLLSYTFKFYSFYMI